MSKEEKIKEFTRILFRWHKKNYRPMQWRNTHDPYRILVSEIMLQQTQVDRVRTKYAKFLKKFPTVRVLASATLGDVLRAWSGLGYNRRAKYLHECAKKVVSLHEGRFPKDSITLISLPGIGISTSAALMAFAFNQDEPMIDTNIRRILTRVFFTPTMSRSDLDMVKPSDKVLYAFAKELIPKGKGREWNYAMLDLGATLCTARNHSDDCPLSTLHGNVSDFVYKKPQKKFEHSNRYYRGRILSVLTEHSATQKELCRLLSITEARLLPLVTKLIAEKLVISKGKSFRLP